MKFNLILSLTIAVNTVIAATLPAKSLPPKRPIDNANTIPTSNAASTSTKVIIPWKSECPIETMESPEQENCDERNGYYIQGAPMDEEGHCDFKYACFLPSDAEKILPDAIKAQDPSECIEIEGHYYCSADLNNFSCENCTFSQFTQMVYETFGEKFHYENIDATQITTPIELPTNTAEKIKCAKRINLANEGTECRGRSGHFIKMSFYPDCDNDYYACFLKNNRKISNNGVAAQNLSECITINGYEYCSVDYTNISCSEGKECTFPELIQEISNTFGNYFSYEKSATTSTEAVSIPEREYCELGNYQYYSEEDNCERRGGKFVYGAPVADDGKCDYKYACFLPSGNARLFPDAFKAEDSSECIDIDGDVYCSADLNNIECPDCTFSQFVERVKDVLDYEFNYDAFDVSKITEPIVLPKDVTPQNVECLQRKPLPDEPYEACRRVDGVLFNMEFHPDCETTYYACFIPRNEESEITALRAQDLSECVTIRRYGHSNVYCAVDYYGGVTCPEGNCSFTSFVQEMSRIYGDYFDYEPYIPDEITDYAENYINDYFEEYYEDYTDAATDYVDVRTTKTIPPNIKPLPTTTTKTVPPNIKPLTITTTTTRTIPNCIPVTVTEKVQEVMTVTVKETVTVTV